MTPKYARRVVGWLAPPAIRDALLDDLDEAWARQFFARGRAEARLWYWWQVVRGFVPLVRMRLRGALPTQSSWPSLERESPMTLGTVLQDLRYAVRMLRRSPGFTAAAAATIALGIGANTAIFSVVHAVLLRPLPYPNADRLVMVWQDLRARGGPIDEWATPGNLADWRSDRALFESMAAIRGWRATLTGQGDAEVLPAEQVTEDYFAVLGATPALGRLFRGADAVPNAPRVVVLSESMWRQRFGGDRSVLGRQIVLSGEPHEVIGVLPSGFRPVVVADAQLWRPDRLNLASPSRGAVVLRVVGRLPAGVLPAQMAPGLDALARRLEQQFPESNSGARINVVTLRDQVVGNIRPGLFVLVGAVVLVLLMACVNIANLLLARAPGRAREMAVRTALGAGRRRVARQLLTESLVLAVIGGGCGLVLSVVGVQAFVAAAPAGTPRLNEIGLNSWMLGCALVLTLVTGALFGLAPALDVARGDHAAALKDGRGAAGGLGQRLRRGLVVVEVAVAIVLLVGSGLLLRSFVAMQRSDLGFDPSNVLTAAVSVPAGKYRGEGEWVGLHDRLLQQVAAVPGVTRAALTSVTPLALGDSDMDFTAEGGAPPAAGQAGTATWYRLVSTGYFETMGMTLLEGRSFEGREPAPVVVVNDALARRAWPGQSAVGRRMRFGGRADAPWFVVIGVISDVKQGGARSAPRLQTFIPYWLFPERTGGPSLVLKTAVPTDAVVLPLRQAVAEIDPELPVSGITPMTRLVARSIDEPRFLAIITGAFAVLAVLLAAVGVYGVTSYAVTERQSEFGVRIALGARPADVFRLVFRDGFLLTAVGVLVGGTAAFLAGRALTSLLFGVTPADPLTFGGTIAAVLLVTALATFLPARRATAVDPATSLRGE